MLNAGPPTQQGYSPSTSSQQYSQLLGPPNQFGGVQNLIGNPQLTAPKAPNQSQGMPFTVPSNNSMDPAQIAMMLMQGRP